MTKKTDDRPATAEDGWVVIATVKPKTAEQKKWWTMGANDVIKALQAWADLQDAKEERKAVKKRGSVLLDSKKKT